MSYRASSFLFESRPIEIQKIVAKHDIDIGFLMKRSAIQHYVGAKHAILYMRNEGIYPGIAPPPSVISHRTRTRNHHAESTPSINPTHPPIYVALPVLINTLTPSLASAPTPTKKAVNSTFPPPAP